MKVVIMAGGKGTRISSVASDIPKPMIKIEGIPVLEREIKCLKDQGFDDIIMTVSHLGNIIMDYFGDGSENSPATGKPFGVHIEYYFEKEPLGNAGALFKIKDKLTSDFLLLNADAMFDVDFNRFVAFHRKRDDEEPVYETKGRAICNGCGADITDLGEEELTEHICNHALNGGKGSYRVDDVKIQTGTKTVTVPEKSHYENKVIGRKCSGCGKVEYY